MATPRKLFISHAVADRPLVDAFVELLELGVGVPSKQIFCSSLKGQSIKPGSDFVDSIREHLDDATCVLALISEAYYASAFCMCELGGTWLQSKSFLPVLVPPVGHESLKAVLGGIQVSKIATEEDLDEIRDELEERLDIEIHKTPRWTAKKTTFLAALPELLKKVSFIGPVDRKKHDKVLGQVAEYRKAVEELEKFVSEKDEIIAELRKVKDKRGVQRVISRHSTMQEEFEHLIEDAESAISGLRSSTREALYYRTQGETYVPEDDEWDDIKAAKENGELWMDEDSEPQLDEDNPKVKRGIRALSALSEWLGSPPADFDEWYRHEFNGERPDLKFRPFWKRHL